MKDADRQMIFSSIIRLSEILQKECETMCEIVEFTDDYINIAKRVGALEEEADDILHEIELYFGENMLVQESEARALYRVLESVENCTDEVEDFVASLVRYNVTSLKDNIVASVTNCERAARKLNELVYKLRDKDKLKSPFKDIIELDHFKIEAKKMYDKNMNKLFSSETDPIEVIRWENIYKAVYDVFDAYEEVSVTCAKYNLSWGS